MKPSEHLQVLRQAAKYTFSVNRKYTLLLIMNAFLSAVTGYIPIYFSARVIDSLVAGTSVNTVIFYVGLTVGIVFAVNLLNTYISSEKDAAYSAIWRNEDWSFSEKSMQMAYASIEDPEVARLRYRVRLESQTGQNLFYLYRDMELFTEQVTRIAASAALTVSFFALPSVPVRFKLAIVAGLAITLAVQMYAARKANELNRNFMAYSIDMNIISEHFSELH